ncbi:Protein of unknown function [Gryllus bimaculatus]|nr:Protein of unknown function [Gryllus bimaculatus]
MNLKYNYMTNYIFFNFYYIIFHITFHFGVLARVCLNEEASLGSKLLLELRSGGQSSH